MLSSGTMTSSVETRELWWDPFRGGHGTVYPSIDGQESACLIAECNKSLPVVEYVAVLGYRYSSPELVGMRIHDTSVVADLTRHDPDAPDPDEPVVSDGTGMGAVEHQDDLVESVGAVLSPFLQPIDVFWELVNFWPRLFLQFTGTFDGEGTLTLLVSTDILGDFQIHSLSIATSVEQGLSEQELQNVVAEMKTQYDELISEYAVPTALALTVGLGWKAIEAVASPLNIDTSLGVLLVMLAAWTVAFVSYLVYLVHTVDEGVTSPLAAAGALTTFLIPFLGDGSMRLVLGRAWCMSGIWRTRRPFDLGLPSGSRKIGLWSATVVLVKVAVLVTCIYYIVKFLEMGLRNWTSEVET